MYLVSYHIPFWPIADPTMLLGQFSLSCQPKLPFSQPLPPAPPRGRPRYFHASFSSLFWVCPRASSQLGMSGTPPWGSPCRCPNFSLHPKGSGLLYLQPYHFGHDQKHMTVVESQNVGLSANWELFFSASPPMLLQSVQSLCLRSIPFMSVRPQDTWDPPLGAGLPSKPGASVTTFSGHSLRFGSDNPCPSLLM